MNVKDANKIFAIRLEASYEDELKYGVYLKTDNTYFGKIVESNYYDAIYEETKKTFRFTGYSWIADTIEDNGRNAMRYPIRTDQFETTSVEAFVELDHMSGFNQTVLDAMHYYTMCISWVIPNYSPLTLKG